MTKTTMDALSSSFKCGMLFTRSKKGNLDDQFNQLQKLQDEGRPDFVVEVVSVFFEDSEKLITNMHSALIGAAKIKNACTGFKSYCEAQNRDRCIRSLQQLDHEYHQLKNMLQTLFRLEQFIVRASGATSRVEGIRL